MLIASAEIKVCVLGLCVMYVGSIIVLVILSLSVPEGDSNCHLVLHVNVYVVKLCTPHIPQNKSLT